MGQEASHDRSIPGTSIVLDATPLREHLGLANIPDKELDVLTLWTVGFSRDDIASRLHVKGFDVDVVLTKYDPRGELPKQRTLRIAMATTQATMQVPYFLAMAAQKANENQKKMSALDFMSLAEKAWGLYRSMRQVLGDEVPKGADDAMSTLGRLTAEAGGKK